MVMENATLQKELLKMSEEKYQEFSKRLLKSKMPILGVRTPLLKAYAKQLIKEDVDLQKIVWHQNVETDLLTGLIMMKKCRNNIEKYAFLREFLPGVDNWAVIDQISSSFKTKDFAEAGAFVEECLASSGEFMRRFAYLHLLSNFVRHDEIMPFIKDRIQEDTYYVMMSEAWLLATLFNEHSEEVKFIIQNRGTPTFIVNKTISKICDSFCVSEEEKALMKTLRRK